MHQPPEQSHEILLNQGMKYWDSGFNAPGSRTESWNFIRSGYEILRLSIKCTRLQNIHSYSTRSSSSDGLKAFRLKKGQCKLSLAPNFAGKLSFMLCWSLVYFFFPFPVFWNLFPYVTKHGIPVLSLPDFTDNFNVSYKRSYNPIGF